MRRGTTYTFRVSGGDAPESNAAFHPFYLTTSITGGFVQLTPAERAAEIVIAGIEVNETDSSGGIVSFLSPYEAPICKYQTTAASLAYTTGDFQGYFNTLDTSCAENSTIMNEAAVLTFTPNATTPDLLYYQCVTHRNLGWKIVVIDADAPSTAAAVPVAAPSSSSAGAPGPSPAAAPNSSPTAKAPSPASAGVEASILGSGVFTVLAVAAGLVAY